MFCMSKELLCDAQAAGPQSTLHSEGFSKTGVYSSATRNLESGPPGYIHCWRQDHWYTKPQQHSICQSNKPARAPSEPKIKVEREEKKEFVAFSLLISEMETNHQSTMLSGFLCVESADRNREGPTCPDHKFGMSQPHHTSADEM